MVWVPVIKRSRSRHQTFFSLSRFAVFTRSNKKTSGLITKPPLVASPVTINPKQE